ncbi:hypothetical protein PC116_g24571 [Phytophthora cactorum]|nr:hypothetical protein PC116_g24571 [Phytophthora cactorum]
MRVLCYATPESAKNIADDSEVQGGTAVVAGAGDESSGVNNEAIACLGQLVSATRQVGEGDASRCIASGNDAGDGNMRDDPAVKDPTRNDGKNNDAADATADGDAECEEGTVAGRCNVERVPEPVDAICGRQDSSPHDGMVSAGQGQGDDSAGVPKRSLSQAGTVLFKNTVAKTALT